MITAVCMNPCFDKYLFLPSLIPGEVNRVSHLSVDLGGKGVNVAVAMSRLGAQARCLCCVGRESAVEVEGLLKKEGVSPVVLELSGKLRTNLKLKDESTGQMTEVNENGPELSEERFSAFLKLLRDAAMDSSYIVLSGSLPKGSGSETYLRCMEAVPDTKCVLDTSGDSLLQGLSAKPFLVKPNLSELREITGRTLSTLTEIRDAAKELLRLGAQNAVVSLGKEGAVLVTEEESLFSPEVPVEVVSTVGAGDTMVAGILYGLDRGLSLPDAFRCGMAAGTAAVMRMGTQALRKEDYEAVLPRVSVKEI